MVDDRLAKLSAASAASSTTQATITRALRSNCLPTPTRCTRTRHSSNMGNTARKATLASMRGPSRSRVSRASVCSTFTIIVGSMTTP